MSIKTLDLLELKCGFPRSRRVTVGVALSPKIAHIASVSFSVYAVFFACNQVLGDRSAATVATRVLSANCNFVLAAALWLNMDSRVLRMLIVRPRYAYCQLHSQLERPADARKLPLVCRVLYFVGRVVGGAVLSTAMRSGKTEMLSVALINVSAMAIFLAVPLFDSIPRSVLSNVVLRVLAILAALVKGSDVIWCMAYPHMCSEFYNDFIWEVTESSSRAANATSANVSNAAARPQSHTLLSTLDALKSCDVNCAHAPTARLFFPTAGCNNGVGWV